MAPTTHQSSQQQAGQTSGFQPDKGPCDAASDEMVEGRVTVEGRVRPLRGPALGGAPACDPAFSERTMSAIARSVET